jgi:hypothetical protein
LELRDVGGKTRLKAADCETLIQELVKVKTTRFPRDDRIIRVCGLTAENKVHVEWHRRGTEGINCRPFGFGQGSPAKSAASIATIV